VSVRDLLTKDSDTLAYERLQRIQADPEQAEKLKRLEDEIIDYAAKE